MEELIDLETFDVQKWLAENDTGEYDDLISPQEYKKIKLSSDPDTTFLAEPGGLLCATQADKRLFTAYLVYKISKSLLANTFFSHNKSIYSIRKRMYINKIPDLIYQDAFDCMISVEPSYEEIEEYIEKETVKYKEKIYDFFKNGGKNGDTNYPKQPKILKKEVRRVLSKKRLAKFQDFCTHEFSNKKIFNLVISSEALPIFNFYNETLKLPNIISEPPESVREIFNDWIAFMKDYDGEMQLRWFENICFHYLFANTKLELPKIFVGIGPNKSGKGTFVKIMETMLWCSPVKRFNQSTAEREYTTAAVFEGSETMRVCDEWLLTKQVDPQTQSLFKSATRREDIVVRDVGKEAKTIRPVSSYILFCNTNKTEESEVMDECFTYFAKWRAYDRFDFQWINWTPHYTRIEELLRIIEDDSTSSDFGKCLFEYIIDLKNKYDNKEIEMIYQEIPSKYKLSESAMEETPANKNLLSMFHIFINYMFEGNKKLWEIISKKDEIEYNINLEKSGKEYPERKRDEEILINMTKNILTEEKNKLQEIFRNHFSKNKKEMTFDFIDIRYNPDYNNNLEKIFDFRIRTTFLDSLLGKDFIVSDFFNGYIERDSSFDKGFKYHILKIIKYKMDKGLQ